MHPSLKNQVLKHFYAKISCHVRYSFVILRSIFLWFLLKHYNCYFKLKDWIFLISSRPNALFWTSSQAFLQHRCVALLRVHNHQARGWPFHDGKENGCHLPMGKPEKQINKNWIYYIGMYISYYKSIANWVTTTHNVIKRWRKW